MSDSVNLINVKNGIKSEQRGLDVDSIDYFGSTMDYYRIAKGNKLNFDEEETLWCTYEGSKIAKEKQLKINIYSIKKHGIISPDLWYDFIDSFKFVRYNYSGTLRLCNHTIVHLNGKKNFIDQNGKLLSDVWFDECHLHADGTGDAAVLKSESLKI